VSVCVCDMHSYMRSCTNMLLPVIAENSSGIMSDFR
jgi:hypothetical protein